MEADFSTKDCIQLASLADNQTVVICADVIEHLVDPHHLIELLIACYHRGAIILTSTPDRIRVRGVDHLGPPPNPSHIREWALREYNRYLEENSLPVTFSGYTINNNIDEDLKTIITIHDKNINSSDKKITKKPVAIISCYNEADIIKEITEAWIHENCDIVFMDNWSTDETWNSLLSLKEKYTNSIKMERFPENNKNKKFEWKEILRRKSEIASCYPGHWIIHADADEIRHSPFEGVTIAEALQIAEKSGANRVNFNLINFRPTTNNDFQENTLQKTFSYFEYGDRPGHFQQKKAWLQGDRAVDLISSGGHEASFPEAVDFCYCFLLQHYPIRSLEHGRRKILTERKERWSEDERAAGWHTQYDHFSSESSFIWKKEELMRYGPEFWPEHGLLIMTDIIQKRRIPKA